MGARQFPAGYLQSSERVAPLGRNGVGADRPSALRLVRQRYEYASTV